MTTHEAPSRIWISPHSATACNHHPRPNADDIEYVRATLNEDAIDALKLLAHPKFTTDDHGRIHYYVTKSDVESARKVLSELEAAANSVNNDEGEGVDRG